MISEGNCSNNEIVKLLKEIKDSIRTIEICVGCVFINFALDIIFDFLGKYL